MNAQKAASYFLPPTKPPHAFVPHPKSPNGCAICGVAIWTTGVHTR